MRAVSFSIRACRSMLPRAPTLEKQGENKRKTGMCAEENAAFITFFSVKGKEVHPFYLRFIFHLKDVCL